MWVVACLQTNNLDSDLQSHPHPGSVILRSRYFEIHQWRQKVCLSPVTTREHLDNKWDVDRWRWRDREIPKQCWIELNSSFLLQKNRVELILWNNEIKIFWVKITRRVILVRRRNILEVKSQEIGTNILDCAWVPSWKEKTGESEDGVKSKPLKIN